MPSSVRLRSQLRSAQHLSWLALLLFGVLMLLAATGCVRGSVSEIIAQDPVAEDPVAEDPVAGDDGAATVDTEAEDACYASYAAVQENADPVQCAEGHQAEIISVFETETEDGTYPGESLLTQNAQQECPFQFRNQTGVAVDTTIAALGIIYPTAAAWDAGNRSTLCVVVFPTAVDQPLADLDPRRAYGLATFYGLERGDCLADLSSGDFLEIVPCARPHGAEVFDLIVMDAGPFPGDSAVENLALNHCFERYDALYQNGATITDAPYDFVGPTERSWNSFDDRTIVCLAYVDPGT